LRYHDEEWGVPVHDDVHLFEMLTLEGAQAGLSWSTVLHKRDGYRLLFHGFVPEKVAAMKAAEREKVLRDASIVRNRSKVLSTVENARALLAVQKEHGSFDAYLWAFVEGRPVQGRRRSRTDLPGQTDLSVRISKDLRSRGFRFVGPTIVYALLQAVGLVNDHLTSCFRHGPVSRMR
jgi:DNA-3-methyladenine glycosylase I